MSNTSLFTWFSSLPPWARGVLIVGGSGVLVYSGVTVVRAINSRAEAQKRQAEMVQYVNDLNALQKAGIHPSYQETQYRLWADAILTQFAGCDPQPVKGLFFNDEDPGQYSGSGRVAFGIINSLHNDADFVALATAWGKRSYDACGWFMGDVTDVTINGAIVDELESSEVAGLNKLLAKKGIRYRF